MAKIIVFSGLDCSGKSTQISFLSKHFFEKKEKKIVFWSRGGYTPGFQILKNFLRFTVRTNLPKPGHSAKREKAFKNKFIRKTWIIVSILDLMLFYGFYLRFKYYLGYNIIFDRYLIDTSIDFQLAYPEEKIDDWIIWKILRKVSLKPNFHFISTIPVKESMRRSKFKFEPFPDSKEILTKRLHRYNLEISKRKNIIFINGLEDISSIKNKIFNLLT